MSQAAVRVEVWFLALADDLVLAASSPIVGPVLDADVDPTAAACALRPPGGLEVMVMHSTSWRAASGTVLLTYVAACRFDAARTWTRVQDYLAADSGATRNGPSHVDVLRHALRHLHFLAHTDGAVAERLGGWEPELEAYAPGVAGLLAPPVLPD